MATTPPTQRPTAPSDAYLRVLADLDAQWQAWKAALFGVTVGVLFVVAMLVGGR
jgi:hypothetical protein